MPKSCVASIATGEPKRPTKRTTETVNVRCPFSKPGSRTSLTTRFVSLSNGRFGHPEEDRAITPREGALLQSFPPDYRFFDTSRDMDVILIGNAVPPRLAQAFVAAIAEKVRDNGAG